jgi:hypothetical protein
MKLISIQKNRWLLCCLFFVLSCKQSEKKFEKANPAALVELTAKIDFFKLSIQNGDIITRTGNDFTSENLRLMNIRDKTYSHCGFAFIEHDTTFVFHAIGGDFNPNQALNKETFETFVNPLENRGFGIYRFNQTEKEYKQLKWLCDEFYQIKLPFDMDFDLKTDDKMYCAEFVGKTLELASDQNLKINRSKIQSFEFIGVDDIMLHNECHKITSLVFK